MARDEKAAGSGTGTARTGGSRRLPRLGRSGAGSAPAGRGRTGKAPAGRTTKTRPTRAARRDARRARLQQVKTAFTLTRKSDPRLVPLLAIAFLVPFVLVLLLGILIGHPFLVGLLGLLLAVVVVTAVFGRRVQRNAFTQVEGQVGAAAAVLDNMRGDWRVTPAVGFTREQDLVHRVLGKPGIVLVGEGAPSRVRTLIGNEKRRLARFVGDTPVYDVVVGDGEGQVPLRGLQKHFIGLPNNVKPKDVNILDRKLKAMAPALPIPKGPVPGGGRMPRGKR
jgi:hypothetical protein